MDETLHRAWRIGDWLVSPDVGEIARDDGRTIKLDPRAMRLLMYLAERPGQVVGVTELLDGVWGKAVVTPHSVYEAIAALRHALEDDPNKPVYLATLPRRGYRLIAPVEPWSPAVQRSADRAADAAAQAGAVARPRRRYALFALGGTALLLALFLSVAWLLRIAHLPARPPAGDKSIAVLPFLDLSENKDQGYFADGLAEELLDVLANVPGLRVISRTSSFQFKGKSEDARAVAANLGVAYLVEGSVRRSGSHVRVAAQLIRATDGVHQWSGRFDRSVDDMLQLQSEIATALGRALELSVPSSERLAAVVTKNSEANDHYLQGVQALDTHSREGAEEAVSQFQAAIALDPQFMAAYSSLGLAHYIQAAYSFVAPDTAFPQVREDALKVLQLNSKSEMGHALLARVATLYSWDWYQAQRESDMALTLAPQNPFVLYTAGDLASVLGDFGRSERLLRASLASDPLSPETLELLSVVLRAEGRFDEAEVESRRSLAISPDYAFAHFSLALILMAEGRREDALAECRREAPDGGQMPCLAEAFYSLGRTQEADAALEEAVQLHGRQAFWIAAAYDFIGQKNRAFEWLERAYRQREPVVEYLKLSTEFNDVRGDPRYKALLHAMHLPD